jgi:hypothetical protein
MPETDKQIDNFFDKVEKRVEDKQKEIVAEAMFSLFIESPHHAYSLFDKDGAPYARGEYDSNHKISINNSALTPHNPPSFDKEMSRAKHIAESYQINSIKIGDNVRVTNTTEHAGDVEHGGPTWGRPGYETYTDTLRYLRDKYKDVTK